MRESIDNFERALREAQGPTAFGILTEKWSDAARAAAAAARKAKGRKGSDWRTAARQEYISHPSVNHRSLAFGGIASGKRFLVKTDGDRNDPAVRRAQKRGGVGSTAARDMVQRSYARRAKRFGILDKLD